MKDILKTLLIDPFTLNDFVIKCVGVIMWFNVIGITTLFIVIIKKIIDNI